MFTGIITHLGKIIQKTDNKLVIEIERTLLTKLTEGISVSVNGICLSQSGLKK